MICIWPRNSNQAWSRGITLDHQRFGGRTTTQSTANKQLQQCNLVVKLRANKRAQGNAIMSLRDSVEEGIAADNSEMHPLDDDLEDTNNDDSEELAPCITTALVVVSSADVDERARAKHNSPCRQK
jgi:hypothetical protein